MCWGDVSLGLTLSGERVLSDPGFCWEIGTEGRAAGAQEWWLVEKSSMQRGAPNFPHG